MILALALMATMVLATQAATLLALGTADVQIAANHWQSTQALFLAEAGIEDAFNALKAPGVLAAAPPVATRLTGLAGPGPTLSMIGAYDVLYQAAGPHTARVIATATLRHGGVRVLRATITSQFTAPVAALDTGSFTLDGTVSILGRCGAVHANGDLDLRSFLVDIEAGAAASGTAAGTYHVPGTSSPAAPITNQPRVAAPSVSAARLLAAAQTDPTVSTALYQLTRDGTVLRWNATSRAFELLEDQQTPASARTVLRGSGPGWEWSRAASDGPARWQIAENGAPSGTFHVEGDAIVSGDPGTASSAPWTTTLIAADVQTAGGVRGGNVIVSGNPRLTAHLPDVAIAADRDIAITGQGGGTYTGLLLAHEQIAITGTAAIAGAIFAEDAEALSDTIAGRGSTVSGSVAITYDCGAIAPLDGPLTIVTWGS